jgi:hypothetical protein
MEKQKAQIRQHPNNRCCIGSPVNPFNYQCGDTWEEAVRRFNLEYADESRYLIFPDKDGKFPKESS